MYNSGKSFKEIAKLLGCSRSTVFYYCNSKGKEKGVSITLLLSIIVKTPFLKNYLKITKSFTGNAVDLAPNYSASNYDYKLDVKLIGKFAASPSISREIVLDTTSIFKPYDPEGLFYSGTNQVLYYTTEKLLENQEYQLVITRNDGEVVKSRVKTICGSTIRKPVLNISFESPVTNKIEWRSNTFNQLAAYYEVIGYFHYKQINNCD